MGGWGGNTPQSTRATANSVHADTKENVWDRFVEQVKTSWEIGWEAYKSEYVQVTLGSHGILKGTKNVIIGSAQAIYARSPITKIKGAAKAIGGTVSLWNGFKKLIKGLIQ